VAGACELGNDPSGSIILRESFDCWLLKRGSVSYSYLVSLFPIRNM
jgi:hypothetical protein